MVRREQIVSIAEGVIDADPTSVWSLVANPERIAEWSGMELVGYMGTELPSPGHNIFVVPGRPILKGRPRRVEIESWDAGSGLSCVVHTEPDATGFELTIHSEVESDAILTRVRLVQRTHVPAATRRMAQRWVVRRLIARLEGIRRAVKQ